MAVFDSGSSLVARSKNSWYWSYTILRPGDPHLGTEHSGSLADRWVGFIPPETPPRSVLKNEKMIWMTDR